MEIIIHLIILVCICYFLYKIKDHKKDDIIKKKETNKYDEFDTIINETLYKQEQQPINTNDQEQPRIMNNEEQSINRNKPDEEIIPEPKNESVHDFDTETKNNIKHILANRPARKVTYKDCMTQNYKSNAAQSYEAILKYFAEQQMNIDELKINILEEKIDYVHDILIPVDNRRKDSFDELTLNIKFNELPLAYTIPPEVTKAEEKSQINRFLKHCSIQKVTTDRNAVRFNQLKDYTIHNPETHCEHVEKASPESNLRYYLIYEHDIKQISKRLGTTIFRTKVYCYCPICRKLVCIIRKEDELGVVNLLEYTPMGKRILKHVEQCVNDSLDNKKRRGYCHDFWHLKESMLLDEFNLVWYPPTTLNPLETYD